MTEKFREVGALRSPHRVNEVAEVRRNLRTGELALRIFQHHIVTRSEALALLDWLAQATGHYPVPEGYRLAPVEPTNEMIRAALMAWGMQMDPMQEIPEMYRAMLAAAPSGEQP